MPRSLPIRLALGSVLILAVVTMLGGVGRADGAISVSPQQQAPTIKPNEPEQIQGDESTLVLPRLEGPRLPPPPPPVESPNIPAGFQGCWEGDPNGWDWVFADGGVAVGGPGKVTFCYSEHEITVPQADVRISVGAHALDLLAHLGLGFSTFAARGISTDVYAITSTRMRGRTNLVVDHTDHWLYVIPTHTGQPSEVDWTARLTGPDTLLVEAQQVIVQPGVRMWGAWHAVFNRAAVSP